MPNSPFRKICLVGNWYLLTTEVCAAASSSCRQLSGFLLCQFGGLYHFSLFIIFHLPLFCNPPCITFSAMQQLSYLPSRNHTFTTEQNEISLIYDHQHWCMWTQTHSRTLHMTLKVHTMHCQLGVRERSGERSVRRWEKRKKWMV